MGRLILKVAAVGAAAALVSSGYLGVGSAAWQNLSTGVLGGQNGPTVPLVGTAGPAPGSDLHPAGRAQFIITVQNPNPFKVQVNTVQQNGPVTVDDVHRVAGCVNPGVSLHITNPVDTIPLIPASGSATYPMGADAYFEMVEDADSACQGATFQVPLKIYGMGK